MTQEEKLKEAKRLYESANADQRYVLESLFPELKESEGEKIRKELLNAFKESEDSIYMVLTPHRRESFIAWLEKQGEQKPAEWSEIDKANLEDSIYFVKEFRRSNLCDNESRLQNSRTCIEWLASLKDRVLPQPKQEWSEEDKAIIDYLLQLINNSHKEPCTKGLIAFGAEAWLKSIRPKNTWKPSEEQITWLYRATDEVRKDSRMKQVLNGLLCDLKKLREE